ncbi:hypothetical protein BDP27DRAFT_596468 [Rhodocollybia butyracea]|uniref:Uncharacterized protein n=1 Tax=Rhodocollybia butyracea TaxID=206335 RepID=A0A9P5P9M5_9AGAR|nr:hypothetical protein BDP27DRAFT_596468 [Rhodocollybia butyracea]
MAVSQYLKLKGFSSGVEYSHKYGYPLFKTPKNIVPDDEFEIIEAVSDSECVLKYVFLTSSLPLHYVHKDTGDDWELIPEDKVDQSSESDVSNAQWLRWSMHCVNSHSHNSDCAKNNKAPKQRLRRTRSLASFNTKGIIQEPILNRLYKEVRWPCSSFDCSESWVVHPALRKPCPCREHRIWQSIERHGCIPSQDMDFCLNLIDY